VRIATIDNIMIEAVAQAFRWQRLLENGTYDCMDEIAKAEKIGPSFVSRVIRLALLAPDIVEGVGLVVWWCVVPWKQTHYLGM
jgi:hypothetical protein